MRRRHVDNPDYEIRKIVTALEKGNQPAFEDWFTANEDGWTVAHEAARRGKLPAGFEKLGLWHLRTSDEEDVSVAEIAASSGCLPVGNLERWDDMWFIHDIIKSQALQPDLVALVRDFEAHDLANAPEFEAANKLFSDLENRRGLPADFDNWDLTDWWGTPIAHAAAEHGKLPAGFDQWHLTDRQGQTVAHIAARYGNLPKDFDQWQLENGAGIPVLVVAKHYNLQPELIEEYRLKEQTIADNMEMTEDVIESSYALHR